MAKFSVPSVRSAGAFNTPRPLSSGGGLVRAGGYMEKRIDVKSRPKSAKALKGSIGGKLQPLPKGMA